MNLDGFQGHLHRNLRAESLNGFGENGIEMFQVIRLPATSAEHKLGGSESRIHFSQFDGYISVLDDRYATLNPYLGVLQRFIKCSPAHTQGAGPSIGVGPTEDFGTILPSRIPFPQHIGHRHAIVFKDQLGIACQSLPDLIVDPSDGKPRNIRDAGKIPADNKRGYAVNQRDLAVAPAKDNIEMGDGPIGDKLFGAI